MHYLFEELLIEAPGDTAFVIGTLNQVLVEFDCAHEWDAVLTEGISSIKILADRWPGSGDTRTKQIDLMLSHHPISDLVCEIIAREISYLMQTDRTWYNKMREEWEEARALQRDCDAINREWSARKDHRIYLAIDNA